MCSFILRLRRVNLWPVFFFFSFFRDYRREGLWLVHVTTERVTIKSARYACYPNRNTKTGEENNNNVRRNTVFVKIDFLRDCR